MSNVKKGQASLFGDEVARKNAIPDPILQVGKESHYRFVTYEVALRRDLPEQITKITIPKRPKAPTHAETRVYYLYLKRLIFELEKTNDENLFIYHREGKWWQMGGYSALMYHHQTAKQIGAHPVVRDDKDFGKSNWKSGVIHLGNLENTLEKIRALRHDFILESPELIIIRVDTPYTAEDLAVLANARAARRERVETQLLPTGKLMPATQNLTDRVAKRIVGTIGNLGEVQRECYGLEPARRAIRMAENFIKMGRGTITARNVWMIVYTRI